MLGRGCAWPLATILLACGGSPGEPAAQEPHAHHGAPEPSHAAPAPSAETPQTQAPQPTLLGRTMPPWQVASWVNTQPLTLGDLRGKVVVVRFWTDTCPFCRASMPALQTLSQELAHQPVVFVGLHHAKPRGRAGAWDTARATAAQWGITFPLGQDADWATLRSWWLDTGDRRATSSTLVLGKDGKVIHVHPGPVYFPSDDPADAKPNADFQALRGAINRGLGAS